MWYDFVKLLYRMDVIVSQYMYLQRQMSALLFIIFSFYGCTQQEHSPEPIPTPPPEITTAYLLEHRIIAYEPKYHEKIIATLPYEIKTFEESYLVYLIARIPDKNSKTLLQSKEAKYYLWLERRADNWQDFVAVRSTSLAPLSIHPHFSTIRQGHYYKEYTIDFTLEQLSRIQDRDLDLLLSNQKNYTSTVTIPSLYIKAYLKMIAENTQ